MNPTPYTRDEPNTELIYFENTNAIGIKKCSEL